MIPSCSARTIPHLRSPERRSMFELLRLFFLVYFLSIGRAIAEEIHRITEEKQISKYENEPSYKDQSWIFESINIKEAWNQGWTGKAVRVRINDDNWEWNHTEYRERLIQFNKNAEEDYSCGDRFNRLGRGSDADIDKNDNDNLNHGAAVTSILAAEGKNEFCGTGIAPRTILSFCKFDLKTTHPDVLMYNVLSQQLGASKNSFDISMNAFAYEGCSSEYRGEIVGLHRKQYQMDETPSRRLQEQEEEIKQCPFLKFYKDRKNRGDDPCLVCSKSDFDFVDASSHRDNIFEVASAASSESKRVGGSLTRVSEACATSVRTYCLRNFRQDEALCTEWIEVINNGNICRFKSNVGGHNYALEQGAKEGRFGLGVVFVFAAGDSYGNGDNVNFQAYAKSRFVMTVGAVKLKDFAQGKNKTGRRKRRKVLKPIHSTYSTSGSSIFVAAPGGDYDSSYQHVGAGGLEGSGNSCVDIGYGTSFAASVVGGVVALMIEANGFLTWRDVRAIIAETSKPVEILDSENNNDDATFGVNAAGVGYSELYGFGLIDATAAVNEAANWGKEGHSMPKELGITASSGDVSVTIDDDSFSTSTSTIRIRDNLYKDEYANLESVSVYLKLRYFNRGNLRITITSPSGTTSLLSPGGRNEYGQLECDEWWEFLTLRSWGESPYGKWKLSITDTKRGSGDVVCIDRPSFAVPREATKLNFTVTCEEFESEGFCLDGRVNDYELRLLDEDLNKTLFENHHGTCPMTALSACCICGGGIRPDDDEVNHNQLEEWKIILGDGTPTLGTKRLSNYDPYLPTTSTYEFIRCRYLNRFGERVDCCNGLEDICDMRVNEVLFATLHNGMNEFEGGNFVVINKEFEIERALEAGYRAFKLDICNCKGELQFCNGGMCNDLGKRDIYDIMFYFREFFARNPSEVAILFFEIRNDVDQYVHMPDFWFLLMQVRGLIELIYVHDAPNSTTPWPTLQELIDNNKKLIMFHYNGPNCTETPLECPSKFHYYNDWISDNYDHEFLEPHEIENRTDSCNVKRPNIMKYNNTFVGLRNFVTPYSFKEVGKFAAINDQERLNKYYAAQDYVESCAEILETDINFIMDDWWGVGDMLRMTQDYNMARALGEKWVAPTPSPTEALDATEPPTEIPTWFPTFTKATPSPTVSTKPSTSPTDTPTGPYDPCPQHNGDCKGCKQNIDECLWCVSSSSCYNRIVFENIFDLDDEILPCAGEDILDSFDTTCVARQSLPSVYDDDLLHIDDNETIANDDDDYTVEVIETDSPTDGPPTPHPTLPPVFVPLSPPTAVESTQNIFSSLFGSRSSGASSLTVFSSGLIALLFGVLILRDI